MCYKEYRLVMDCVKHQLCGSMIEGMVIYLLYKYGYMCAFAVYMLLCVCDVFCIGCFQDGSFSNETIQCSLVTSLNNG